jgi:hypothetical protein
MAGEKRSGFSGWVSKVFTEEVDSKDAVEGETLSESEIESLMADEQQFEGKLSEVAENAGALDFNQIFHTAGIQSEGMATAEKALEIIHAQPQSLSLEVKRASVKATLSALGVNIDKIKRDVIQKGSVLDAFRNAGQKQLTQFTQSSEEKIKGIEEEMQQYLMAKNDQIEELRKSIKERQQAQRTIEEEVAEREEEMRVVVEFFTPDSLPSSGMNPKSTVKPPKGLE